MSKWDRAHRQHFVDFFGYSHKNKKEDEQNTGLVKCPNCGKESKCAVDEKCSECGNTMLRAEGIHVTSWYPGATTVFRVDPEDLNMNHVRGFEIGDSVVCIDTMKIGEVVGFTGFARLMVRMSDNEDSGTDSIKEFDPEELEKLGD